MATEFVSQNEIRARFSATMSEMYREEVPAYGDLVALVADINDEKIAQNPELEVALENSGELGRISEERHGAIRLGKASELRQMARFFALLGMSAVGYYDLAPAGIPVHSTAFRPTTESALTACPFRVFSSLLVLDSIRDEKLRSEAENVLLERQIFTNEALELLEVGETQGGLSQSQVDEFIPSLVETFKWHAQAGVSAETYKALKGSHQLVADIVSFKGPHINHLTPRTLDIDVAHATMASRNMIPKETIEGPPKRNCPILLRQTSFKALDEKVVFVSHDGSEVEGLHTARFGEIEQRGVALTPKGRSVYDGTLAKYQELHEEGGPRHAALSMAFADFPDDWSELRVKNLAYFRYSKTHDADLTKYSAADLEKLLDEEVVRADPITYEDFLPVSAAGIFRSNLGDEDAVNYDSNTVESFSAALGSNVADPFVLYRALSTESMEQLFTK